LKKIIKFFRELMMLLAAMLVVNLLNCLLGLCIALFIALEHAETPFLFADKTINLLSRLTAGRVGWG
jgi:hypothetical protein